MKTLPVATFNERAPADQLRRRFLQAGMAAVLRDESNLERFWFISEPLAAIHVEVPQPDYLRARRLLNEWESSTDLMRTAVRCPECQSSRIEFPQTTRKFLTPAICQMVLMALHVMPRQYYCLDCHFTWPKAPKVEAKLEPSAWPLNKKS